MSQQKYEYINISNSAPSYAAETNDVNLSQRPRGCCAHVFLLIAIGLLLGGTIHLMVWGLGFKQYHHRCDVIDYSLAPGQYCPWPDTCYDSYCVGVRVNYYEKPGETHQAIVFMEYGERGCWTTDTYSEIVGELSKEYPVGSNQTCYRGRYDVHFLDLQAETFFFYFAIGFFVVSFVALCLALLGYVCQKVGIQQ